jgi:hypothetical protein
MKRFDKKPIRKPGAQNRRQSAWPKTSVPSRHRRRREKENER